MSKEVQTQNGGGFFGFFGKANNNVAKIEPDQLDVVNPDGGQEDGADEASKDKWGVGQEEKEGYFKMMQKYVGADITSLVTLPVIIFEPMTMLQKMCELMEYTELLNKADMTDDPSMRMVYTVAWAVSVYPAYERTWKPFNPILGETYEFTGHNNIVFVNEQVSHHPPLSVGHGENEHFEYDCTSKVKTKFLGNSLEVFPLGRTRVKLKRSGHVLELTPPPTKVHNLIFGRTWIDSPGDMVLTNITTGEKAVLYFQPCGWFGAGRYEVDGYAYDANEEPRVLVTGKWNESLSCQPCDTEGEPLPNSTLTEVWHVNEFPKNDAFQYTNFAHKINSFESAPEHLLPSDSRLRSDRYALEKGDMNKSGIEKSRLEERQRAERKEREKKGDTVQPKWFKATGDLHQTPWGELEMYEFTGAYLEHRRNLDKGKTPATMTTDPVAENSAQFDPWQYKEIAVTEEVKPTAGLVVN